MTVRLARPGDVDALAEMCVSLWPHTSLHEERLALIPILEGRAPGALPHVFFIAADGDQPAGFAEVALRSHADGCNPDHAVGFLEGWFVGESYRGRGIGRALIAAAENWAREHGCTEFASDTWIDNVESQQAHEALGFEIVDRCVHYRKNL